MSEIVVWGRASSSSVQAVMWGAAELGLTVDRRDVGGRFGGLDAPAFRAMTPHGLIPVLRDGDVTMFESAAILRHLARTRSGLLPRDPKAAAAVDMWAEWGKGTLARGFILDVFWAGYRTPAEDRDMAAVTAAVRRFEAGLELIAPQIVRTGWVAGAGPTLADIWPGHVLYRYFTMEIERRPPDGIEDWYRRLTERPAYRAHVMIDYSELAARTVA
ncbi:glutathione S-transferase [Rhodobacteraceae bacterium CCMM004]|nr:glutathione S-transferase [Rhodobacteraceae bacterium CCMM004]